MEGCHAAGVYLFNAFLRKVELRRLFLGLALAGVAAGFTQLLLVTGAVPLGFSESSTVASLASSSRMSCMACAGANRSMGLDDKLFVLADSVLVTGLGRIALMPCLVLAARICPEVMCRALPLSPA